MFKEGNLFNIGLFCGSLVLFFHVFVQASRFRITGGFWTPGILLIGIALFSGKLLLENLKNKGAAETEQEGQEIVRNRLVGLIASCFFYSFAMNYLGFVFSTPFYLASILSLLGIRKLRHLTLLPLGISLALFLVFIKVLNISLPRGMGPFLYFSRLFY